MAVYRSNLNLRLTPLRAPDRPEALARLLADPTDGNGGDGGAATVIRAPDAAAADALADFLRQRHIPARVLRPGRRGRPHPDNAAALAGFHTDAAPVLLTPAPLALFPAPPRRTPRRYIAVGLPGDLRDFADDLAWIGVDGLEAGADVFAARADIDFWNGAWAARGRWFAPRAPSSSWLGNFDAGRAEFLRALLRLARPPTPDGGGEGDGDGAARWFHIDDWRAARELATEPAAIREALDYLEKRGWLRYPAGDHPVARRAAAVRAGWSRGTAASASWAESTACWWLGLSRALGESFDRPCGHCGWCLGRRPGLLPQ